MSNYPNAGDGLRKIYLAAIGAIVCSIIMVVPFVAIIGSIGAIVCSVITLIGFYQAGKDIEGCKIAFALQICSIAINLIGIFVEWPGILDIIAEFVPMIAVCLMLWSVSQVMKDLGAEKVAKQGMVAMFVYIGCEVAAFILSVFALAVMLSGGLILYLILLIGIAVVELVFYLKFLKNSAEQLGSYF